jgi:hypothetical protein
MHATGVQLYDPFGIGQSSVTDASLLGIQFRNVHSRHESIQNVGSFNDLLKREFDTTDGATVLVPDPTQI